MAEINTNFPCQTQLDERTIVLQQRRADCAVETAMMFDLAAEYFKDDKYQELYSQHSTVLPMQILNVQQWLTAS